MEKEAVVKLVINNIDEYLELIEKSQKQALELQKTLEKIQMFSPDCDLTKKKQD